MRPRLTYADARALPLSAEAASLSDYRRARLAGLKSELARRESLGAELLLRRALGAPEGEPLRIGVRDGGKPFLPDREVFFSLSHSGGFVLCALSDRELGADLQRERRWNESVARRCFAPPEREWILSAADRDAAFHQVWAMKESYIKALGTGLSLPLNSFSVPLDGLPGENCGGWRFWHTCREGLHFALCSRGEPRPELFEEVRFPPAAE